MRCPPSGPGGGPPRAASPLLPLQGPKVSRPGLHIETAVAVVSAWSGGGCVGVLGSGCSAVWFLLFSAPGLARGSPVYPDS